MMKKISTTKAPAAVGPYSQATAAIFFSLPVSLVLIRKRVPLPVTTWQRRQDRLVKT